VVLVWCAFGCSFFLWGPAPFLTARGGGHGVPVAFLWGPNARIPDPGFPLRTPHSALRTFFDPGKGFILNSW
jgi:hypothetical protein